MKYFLGVFAALFLWLIFPKEALAARNLSITSDKTSLFGDEEMVITASPSGFIDGESIYIKGAFYQEGLTNYFGYTEKGSSWIKNGEATADQLLIKIGEWDGKLWVKSDFSDSGYKGEGDYKFKVGFYYTTTGGNLSSVNWSTNVLTITLNEPDPTPSPTPTPAPTPTPTPAPTSTPTPTPTPTKTPSPPPVSTETPGPTTKVLAKATDDSQDDINKIRQTLATPTPETLVAGEETTKRNFSILALFFISTGLALIGWVGYTYLQKQKDNENGLPPLQ